MKNKLIFFPFILLILYILVCPKEAVNAASLGLMLWYQKVLPTLLPFSILSGILIESNYLSYLTKYLYPITHRILPTSKAGSFVFFSGFLFGFPMGSKNCALLYKKQQISKKEAELLTILCNNISPVFVGSFIVEQTLQTPSLLIPSYLFLYLPPIILGNLFLRFQKNPASVEALSFKKMPAPRFQMNFKIIDTGIMNGFETLTKLGGYIMFFSMIASLLSHLRLPVFLYHILIGVIELTNGILGLSHFNAYPTFQYVAAMGFTAFGGISGLAQTFSITKDCHFSRKRYILYKLILTVCTITASMLYLYFKASVPKMP